MEKNNSDLTRLILEEVKKNKKYKSISDEIVLEEINKYLRSNKNLSGPSKQTIKDIRKNLHLSYASFQTKKKSKSNEYLVELKKDINSGNSDLSRLTKKLLSMTLSTKERIEDYPSIYQQIFTITKEPRTILDLGCGLNPLSFPLMNLRKLNYFAYDINDEDINFLNNYFGILKNKGLVGKAEIINLNNKTQINNLPNSDIIFLFKVLDLLDNKYNQGHKPSEQLIIQLIEKTKFIVASFATRTITRKKMNFPNRKWFELMLERNNLKFKTFNTDNEIFYVVYR